jgi:hypothetical protein
MVERLEHALVFVAYIVLLPFSRWQWRGKLQSSPGCSPAFVTTWSRCGPTPWLDWWSRSRHRG